MMHAPFLYEKSQRKLWIRAKVQPGAKSDACTGFTADGGALRLTVRPHAMAQKATEAAMKLLADMVCVPRRCIHLVTGKTHRQKVFLLEDVSQSQWEVFQECFKK